MKHWKNPVISALLAALMLLSLTACGTKDGGSAPAEAETVYENDGMKLTIPEEYAALLLVETPENDADGILFAVAEKASVEAAKAMGGDTDGAGELFRIGVVSEDALHEMLCGEMSGAELFAVDADGAYYVYYHPTDVRFTRESVEQMEADQAQWSALNEWAWSSVRDGFAAENGLTPETRGNSSVDTYLNRAAYQDGANYTVSTLEYGPLPPNGVDAAPFVERLTRGATYTYADGEEAPDGEYIVLYFPDEDVRFDFFSVDGGLVRQVSGDYETLYRYTGSGNAHDIMQEWYDALAAASGVAGAADLSGQWQDEISQRASMDVTRNDDGYTLLVHWGSSASEASVWEIAGSFDKNGTLTYEDGKYTIHTFDENGVETVSEEETTRGSFTLEDGKLRWQDSKNDGEGLFVKIG